MPYVPLHERIDPPSRAIRYASPDLDPRAPLVTDSPAMSDDEAGPSRKRRRGGDGDGEDGGAPNGEPEPRASYTPRGPAAIAPSIFGIAPRNEFTKVVGEFIMAHCRGRENVEVEIKLGTLHAPGDGPPRRVRMPAMTEAIVPSDWPVGRFASTMNKKQHFALNGLLNSAVEGAARTPTPLKFFRARQVDSFHSAQGGKVRVSRDPQGAVIPDGVVKKSNIAHLNVYSPREAFDWRVSCNTETPAELPTSPAQNTRQKDRACYRHQLCQVDLTVVTARESAHDPKAHITYELEIEILDVPALIAEGEKEERGDPNNRFDEILQSVLDTARMLIKNVNA
ncbi:mRNA-capping enzyme subunit beta [Vanrija albida]|uniref:mRNA-capping enzyme subunit beta n=1 Tax=Vanrija albida TaxID=181172 RepID=A0ABR3Q1X1_9TREE